MSHQELEGAECLPCCRLFSYMPSFLWIMLTALSPLQPGLGAEEWLSVRREGWGSPQNGNGEGWWREGSNAVWGRARMLYMQSNSSTICLPGICRAVQFTALSSVCVRQMRSRSLKFSTWVLGCTAGRGSMLCVMSLTWNEPCHTHPTSIWYYHPASAIQLSSWFHMSEANPSNDKTNPKRCLKDFCPKGRTRKLIKKESLALLFCT